MTIYHVIEGVFFALNWNTFRGEACVQLMHGEPSKGELVQLYLATQCNLSRSEDRGAVLPGTT